MARNIPQAEEERSRLGGFFGGSASTLPARRLPAGAPRDS